MTDRPIIFSAPMIRALLDGRKTQTRRIVRLPNWAAEINEIGDDGYTLWCVSRESGSIVPALPQYLPHDRLWVREAWSGVHRLAHVKPSNRITFMEEDGPVLHDEIWYWADGSPEYGDWEKPRPSTHMPRWASRLTLVVTDVRVERLQDISEADARAEGVSGSAGGTWGCEGLIEDYSDLWNSIYGPDAWDANPWVAALTFDVHRCNIGQMYEVA